MSLVLSGLCWSTCLVYLDSIIVFSQTVDEHLQYPRDTPEIEGFWTYNQAKQLSVIAEECTIFGALFREGGVEVDPKMTSCVRFLADAQ